MTQAGHAESREGRAGRLKRAARRWDVSRPARPPEARPHAGTRSGEGSGGSDELTSPVDLAVLTLARPSPAPGLRSERPVSLRRLRAGVCHVHAHRARPPAGETRGVAGLRPPPRGPGSRCRPASAPEWPREQCWAGRGLRAEQGTARGPAAGLTRRFPGEVPEGPRQCPVPCVCEGRLGCPGQPSTGTEARRSGSGCPWSSPATPRAAPACEQPR